MNIRWLCKTFSDLNKDELYQILALRQQVFVVEQKIIYQDADGKDFQAIHVMGKIENKTIAYARIIFLANKIKFGRVLVDHAHRRKGIAKQLVEQILKYIKLNSPQNHPIEISAQAYLINFYQQFGFKIEGEIYLEEGIEHIKMSLN